MALGSNPRRDLVVGRVYPRQQDLHRQGLSGNWQKGISYPQDGTYVLLFSDPSRERDFGYKDAPTGSDGFLYYGEWDGTGDMTMTGGNAAIRDRSPELHLFVAADGGHRYEGQFAYESHDEKPTVRDGRQFNAIVFRLVRVVRPAASGWTPAAAPDMHAFVRELVGQEIQTLTGRPNRVLSVTGDTALVGTERSPAGQEVDLRQVQEAADELYERGEIVIEVEAVGYRSAFVGAVLSLLPGAEADIRPRRIRLRSR